MRSHGHLQNQISRPKEGWREGKDSHRAGRFLSESHVFSARVLLCSFLVVDDDDDDDVMSPLCYSMHTYCNPAI